jgi:uncharacterized protein YggE
MKIFTLTFVSFLISSVAFAEPEIKGSPTELRAYLADLPKIVSITGESELKVAADRALITLKVVTENKSLQEASRANQEIRARMLRTLGERGIPADRIKPSRFSSTPKYGMFGEKAKSYRVENFIKIKAEDEKEFQAVGGLVDSFPEVRYDSIEFEHSDKDGLKAKALGQALEKATEKKRLYEEKLNVKLTPKAFGEGVVTAVPEAARAAYGKGRIYGVTSLPQANVTTEEAGDAEMPASFDELIYRGRVTVEYAVESK